MSTWEGRMSARAAERKMAKVHAEVWASLSPERQSPVPPDDGTCHDCYEWRRFPPGQEHFGYGWWRTCSARGCEHAHHDDEIWTAAS